MKNADLEFFGSVFRKYWRILLAAALLGAILSFTVSKTLIPPKYRAQVSLFTGRVESTAANSNLRDLQSELMLAMQLMQDYRFLLDSARISDKVKQAAEEKFPQFKNRFTIKPEVVRQTRLIKITADSINPELSRFVAQQTADVFLLEIQAIMKINNAQIIDSAIAPLQPFSPNVPLNTAIGLFGCLLLTFAALSLHALFDTRIRTITDISDELNLSIIGTIPEDKGLAENVDEKSNCIISLEATNRKRFGIAEAYRLLRSNVQYADINKKNGGKVFVITSTFPGEGKTTTSANTAASLADSGRKTLIINCDLHKPALAKTLNLTSTKGLVNILAGENEFDEVVIRNYMNLPLDVLLCGPIPPNPSRLLLSDSFHQLIDMLRMQYDYIILDAPPALNVADPTILGQIADGIIMVIRANSTRAELAGRVCEMFQQLKIPMLGAVLNRVPPRSEGYGYGYGYGGKKKNESDEA